MRIIPFLLLWTLACDKEKEQVEHTGSCRGDYPNTVGTESATICWNLENVKFDEGDEPADACAATGGNYINSVAGTWTDGGTCDETGAVASCYRDDSGNKYTAFLFDNRFNSPFSRFCSGWMGAYTEITAEEQYTASSNYTPSGEAYYCTEYSELNFEELTSFASNSQPDTTFTAGGSCETTGALGVCTGADFSTFNESIEVTAKETTYVYAEGAVSPNKSRCTGTWTDL